MIGIFEAMGVDVGLVVLLLMFILIVLIIAVMVLSRNLKQLRKQYHAFMRGMDGESLEGTFQRRFAQVSRLNSVQEQQEADLKLLHIVQDKSLTKYGIVKYDAFEDVGGKLSFVLALLNKMNSGFVLNAIHSRDNCFLYIKEVVNGESYIMLSDEEIEALKLASKYGDDEMMTAAELNV